MRKFLFSLLFLCPFAMNAQVATSTFEDYSFVYNYETFAIGENALGYLSWDKDGLYLSKFDSTTKQVWEKEYPLTKKSSRRDYSAHDKTGKDIYVLSFDNVEDEGGGSGLSVTHIDAISGLSSTRSYPGEDYGHVLDQWCTSRYFFVRTTKYKLDDDKIEKDPGMKLYRFDKKSLSMEKLEHEMGNASRYPRVFWNFVRYEEDFVEGYVVNEAGHKISLTLARFDNDGKKIKSATSLFELSGDNYTRQISMGKNTSYSYSTANANVTVLIYPSSSVKLMYCDDSKNYYAFGVCGPDEQQKIATVYTGFFVARMDSAFGLATFKEHTNIPELDKDSKFRIHAAPDSRYINMSYIGDRELVIFVPGHAFKIDQRTLAFKQPKADGEVVDTYDGTRKIIKTDHYIGHDATVQKSNKQMTSYMTVITHRWQFAFIQNYSSGKVQVFSAKL